MSRGTTPRRAGERLAFRRSGGQSREQPRMSGERGKAQLLTGTTPQKRGKGPVTCAKSAREGTTPHTRGKLLRICGGLVPPGTTPHTRGIRAKRPLDPAHAGTTPHTRGKGASLTGGMVKDRNNPAYAGKRSAHGLPASTSGEQPRIRGEKRRMMGSSCVPEGTTPRMRGKDSITSRFIEHLSSCHSTGSYTTPIK